MSETKANTFNSYSNIVQIVPLLREVVKEGEESLRREKHRVCELQQELEQEKAVSLCKAREEEERRGVRTNMNEILKTNTSAESGLFIWSSSCMLIVHSCFLLEEFSF